MKKQSVSLLVLLLAASSVFFACGSKMNKSMERVEFDSIRIDENAHLFGDTAKPACQLTIGLTYVTRAATEGRKDSLNGCILSACLGNEYAALPPQEAVERYKEQYVRTYRADLEEDYLQAERDKDEGEWIDNWYSYYLLIEGKVGFHNRQLFSYAVYTEEYTGGAHGMNNLNYINIDLKDFTRLTLDDLFEDGYREPVGELLWKQLAADRGATREELEENGYGTLGDLEPNENFALGPKGITFVYNPYEIAPYAAGRSEITLAYDSLTKWLRRDNRIIMELAEN